MPSADLDRAGVHFDVADLAVRAHVAEDEVVALLRARRWPSPRAPASSPSDVDVPDAHRAQLARRVLAVEIGGGHVGVDDRAGRGIDEELHGAVVLEHLPVAALALAERVFLALLLDGRGDVLGDEDEDLVVALACSACVSSYVCTPMTPQVRSPVFSGAPSQSTDGAPTDSTSPSPAARSNSSGVARSGLSGAQDVRGEAAAGRLGPRAAGSNASTK